MRTYNMPSGVLGGCCGLGGPGGLCWFRGPSLGGALLGGLGEHQTGDMTLMALQYQNGLTKAWNMWYVSTVKRELM